MDVVKLEGTKCWEWWGSGSRDPGCVISTLLFYCAEVSP